ncbi:MAG: addiction module toxin, HicA family [Candidatus Zambryskibacteria bacterium RIFCSPHIGHO2_02_FULL_43_14]|uniref:Addiction module toxin, HicA family n=1 Tax=Candidatus Zambryskibacteria bacterium RIFCSPHIGHO2_02_FULL_43_14 TaxID=1802748 RepID=A0A1G2TFP4_9BACT|nr:MAG: addiction module toxin, HicA family [Candidatus Zambryskibacteria bacterium RIFCSPHIGHO2_01_FULL_43_60]OHA96053.1 MAG: addiction module toxin, HicA family [Candidatus Zambryskibacteria bacterium RIFCSPHIGHO2_02_FULL_43_14]
MKRIDLIRHLRKSGCTLVREGSNHSIFVNIASKRATSVPRHSEVNTFTARKICRDLGIGIEEII